MGPEALSLADIEAYCRIHLLDSRDRLVLYRTVSALDGEWLTWANKKSGG